MSSAIRLVIAIFAAMQVWAWMRFLGGMLATGSLKLEYVALLFNSVGILDIGLKGFVMTMGPVLLAYYLGLRNQSSRLQLLVFVCICMAWGLAFHLYTWGLLVPSYSLYFKMLSASLVSAVVAGFVLWSMVFVFQSKKKVVADETTTQPNIKRRLVLTAGTSLGGLGVIGSAVGPARILSHASDYLDIDISKLNEGEFIVAELGVTPIWILKRTDAMIAALNKENPALYDANSDNSQQPQTAKNPYRSIDPRYFVTIAVCTHLGCSPKYYPEGNTQGMSDLPQFFCPCHGGVFDLAGRVIAGTPPPRNLDVPNYEILGSKIRIYYPTLTEEWSRIP